MSKSQSEELFYIISAARPAWSGDPARAARSLVRAAKALHRFAELACERSLTHYEVQLEGQHMARVSRWCNVLGIVVKFNGDPRGFPVKLHFGPDKRTQPHNTWGGPSDGWGIG